MAAARQTPLTCSGHTRPVVDLCYSPMTADGFFLISACKDGKPMLRKGDTGDWLGTFEGHKGAVWGATLDKTAERAATGAADFSAKIWDALSGAELHSFSHSHIVKAVDFSQDREFLLTGCNDKLVRRFNLAKPEADPMVFKGHEKMIKKALLTWDGTKAISGADDKTVRVWDTRTGELASSLTVDGPVTNMQLSQDGKTLVVTFAKTVAFYDAETMDLKKKFEVPSHPFAASLHPDGHIFVWGGEDNYLHVMDYATGEQKEEYKGHFGPVHCVSFSPDGEIYASGSEDGTVRLWQTNVGTEYGLWRFSQPDVEEAS